MSARGMKAKSANSSELLALEFCPFSLPSAWPASTSLRSEKASRLLPRSALWGKTSLRCELLKQAPEQRGTPCSQLLLLERGAA